MKGKTDSRFRLAIVQITLLSVGLLWYTQAYAQTGPGTICVVQIRADGDVLTTLADDQENVNIVLLVPGRANVPVLCQDLKGLAMAVANQADNAVDNLQIEVFTNRGVSLCTRPRDPVDSFSLPVNGARGITLNRDCLP